MTVICLFFMQKFNHKGGMIMFSDEILEKIFSREDVRTIPLEQQSIMIHAIEEVLQEEKTDDAE